jgi:DNA replication protein DnaC
MGDFELLGDMLGKSALNSGARHARDQAGRLKTRRIVPADGESSLSCDATSADDPKESEEPLPMPATATPSRGLLRVVSSDQVADVVTEASASPVCPRCKGAQWLRSEDLAPWDPQYKKRVECECLLQKRREKRRQELFALCRLPEEHLVPTLQTFRPHVRGVQQAFRATMEFIHHAGEIREVSEDQRRAILDRLGWIVLRGSVGVGKTHLAMAVSVAALELGIETLFSTVPDLLDHLRAAFAPTSEIIYDELFERMKKAELLVLDDLGTQRSSPWADEKLFQLFNSRYNHRLPTCITLNEQAWNHLDERLQSRLLDASLVQVVDLRDAQDYRRRQGKNAVVDGSSSLASKEG